MDWLKYLTDIVAGVPGNVLGEVAGDLVELGAKWIKDRHKQNKFVKRVGEALERFLRVPGGEDFLEEVAKNAPPPPKKRLIARGEKDLGRELAEHAMENVDGFNIETWSARLLQNVDTARFGKDVQKEFLILLGEIRGAAAEYWKSFLERKDFAIVNLIAQTVNAQTAGLQETIRHEIQSYLFVSGPDAQPPKVQILQCTNCGKDFSPSRLQRTESGLLTCNCPDCGTALTMGSFTEEGQSWAKECDEKLDLVLQGVEECRRRTEEILAELTAANERRLRQIAVRRKKLAEVTHEQNINEEDVLHYSRKLLELCPEDALAKFYIMVSENGSDPQRINRYLDELDVAACGRETLCAMLDYLVEPLEPRMEVSLLDLVERAFQSKVFLRGDYERYETAIQKGRSFDPNATYDLFIAYSHKDLDEVRQLVAALEREELTCFWAFRDLPHGRGSGGETYWNNLKRAMEQSRGIVFVSTPNSRSRSCDTIERADKALDNGEGELPYFEKHFPREEKFRIEYRPPCDYSETTPKAIRDLLKRFFGSVSYCQTIDEVCEIATKAVSPMLYGTVDTQNMAPMSEVEAEKRKKAEQEAIEKQIEERIRAEYEKRLAEERKNAEEARRRLEEETKRKDAEVAAAQAEKATEERRKSEKAAEGERTAEEVRRGPEEGTREEVGYEVAAEQQLKAEGVEIIPRSELCIEKGVLIGFTNSYKIKSLVGKRYGVIIPEGVTAIGDRAFSNCDVLTSIVIPNSVTSIGGYAFWSCDVLTSITIFEGVTKIGDHAFASCRSLTSITIPKSVKSIGPCAFSGCGSLTSITIPEGVTEIGNHAFYNCSSLISITVPKSATTISMQAFYGCSAIGKIEVADGNKHYHVWEGRLTETASGKVLAAVCESARRAAEEEEAERQRRAAEEEERRKQDERDGVLPASAYDIENGVLKGFKDRNQIENAGRMYRLVVPAGVTKIAPGAFKGVDVLQGITISDGVVELGESAFENCRSVAELTISDSVTSFGEDVFSGCEKIQTAKVPAHALGWFTKTSLKSVVVTGGGAIRERSFGGCTALESVTISEGITSIEKFAFGGGYYSSSELNPLTDLKLPQSLTAIGEFAFLSCKKLQTVTMPTFAISAIPKASLRTVVLTGGASIEDGAFSDCGTLQSITIPKSVTSIGGSAFERCGLLREVVIPQGVKKIGQGAFSGCGLLQSVTIPEGVTSIEPATFYNCGSLQRITIPESVTAIRGSAFSQCGSLTDVTIPKNITQVHQSAFEGCDKIGTATMPVCAIPAIPKTSLSTVVLTGGTSIEANAFSGCDTLTGITIPEDVSDIGANAFSGCGSLAKVTLQKLRGWRVSTNPDLSHAKRVTEAELGDPASAARLFTGKYCGCFWKRKKGFFER